METVISIVMLSFLAGAIIGCGIATWYYEMPEK